MKKEDNKIDLFTLNSKEILELFRLSVAISVYICFIISFSVALFFVNESKFLIYAFFASLSFLVVSSSGPRFRLPKYLIGILGSGSSAVVSGTALLSGTPFSFPIGVGLTLGTLLFFGSAYINKSSKSFPSGAYNLFKKKLLRTSVWIYIFSNGWEITYPKNFKKKVDKLFNIKKWEIRKRVENSNHSVHELNVELIWKKDCVSSEIVKREDAFNLSIKSEYLQLNEALLEIEEFIEAYRRSSNYMVILTKKWQNAFSAVSKLKKILGDDETLIKLIRDPTSKTLIKDWMDLIPSNDLLLRDKKRRNLISLIEMYKEIGTDLFQYYSASKERYVQDITKYEKLVLGKLQNWENKKYAEIIKDDDVTLKINELNELITEMKSIS